MPSILFVCTANRFRSPIAAAAFDRELEKAKLSKQWVIGSAGTWTTLGLPPIPPAISAANEHGLDITDSTATLVNHEELSKYDLVLVMEAGQKEAIVSEFPQVKERVFLLSEAAGGKPYDIPDPFCQDRRHQESEPMEIAAEIIKIIEKGFPNICALAHKLKAGR